MLDKFFSAVFDQEHEFNDIWELKLIKFDTNLSDDIKPYEKHIAISSLVEDTKGNPGVKGYFTLSNLRIVWYSQTDKDINLSIGLDTINNVIIKSIPVSGYSEFKHLLTLKAVSPSQVKFQFKFIGFTEKEERIFKKVSDVFRKFAETKFFRNIDTSIKLLGSQFKPMDEEQAKTRYEQCVMEENERKKDVLIILTNIRLIIIHDKIVGTNYGIPWIMIEGFSKVTRSNRDALQVKIRGLLKNVEIYLTCTHRADFSKLHKEIVSFCETYNKNPNLGVNFSSLDMEGSKNMSTFIKEVEVQEIEQTKVNIGRRKNAYGDKDQKGSLRDTYFNDELGLMMERIPEGSSRKDLWDIFRA